MLPATVWELAHTDFSFRRSPACWAPLRCRLRDVAQPLPARSAH